MKILFSAFGLVFYLQAFSATYYIDATGGSDANSGLTTGLAWQTFDNVTNVSSIIAVNDTILLKRGEQWNTGFSFPTNGVTLDAYGSGALPVVDGQSTWTAVVSTGSHWDTMTRNIHMKNGVNTIWNTGIFTNTVEDCTIENATFDGVSGGGDSHSIVRRCTIMGTGDDGVTLHVTASALVESCIITNCSFGINNSGDSMALTVNDTLFVNNLSADVAPLGNTVSTFNRCRWAGRASGGACKLFDGGLLAVTFNYCTFDGSKAASVTGPEFSPGNDSRLNNCVFYGGASGNGKFTAGNAILTNCIFSSWWKIDGTGVTISLDHSILHNLTFKVNVTETSVVSTSDPLFVSPTTADFHLLVGSPAIDTGIDVGFTTDLEGNAVGNPPDVGAYAYSVIPPDFTNQFRLRKSPISSARRR